MNAMNASTLIPPVIPAHPQSPYGNWLTGFPLRSFLELGAYENAPGSARGHSRNVLAEWGLAAFTDVVCLVISELVTNSLRATGKVTWEGGLPPVRMWLLGGARGRRGRPGDDPRLGRGCRAARAARGRRR
jgi:hypothetical protein